MSAPSSEDLLSLKHLLGEEHHPLQPTAILAREYEVAMVGGQGAGKTYAACVAAIRHGAKFPGARILIGRLTYKEMLETTKHLFFEIVKTKGLERFFVRPRVWDVREGTNYARMTNGSEFFFSNLDKSLDKHKNVEYSFVFIDQAEEIDYEVYELLLLRCRLSAVPYSDRHVMIVANDEGDNWIRKRFLTYESPHNRPTALASRLLVRGTSFENPHLDDGIRAQYHMLAPDVQRRWVYATMDAGASRLLPDFRVIDTFAVPLHWPRWVGIDPARASGVTCAEWVTANPDSQVWRGVAPGASHIYREYWEEGRDAEVHAEAILALSGPRRILVYTMDKTTWATTIKSKRFGSLSVADLYVRAGLPVSPSQGDEWTRVMLFTNAHKKGLTVASSCVNLLRQGPEYRLKGQQISHGGERKQLQIVAKKKFHSVDAGGYGLSMVPTRLHAMDVRKVRMPFEIAENLDRGSQLHWENQRMALPRLRGRDSVVTEGVDDVDLVDDHAYRSRDPRDNEDDAW